MADRTDTRGLATARPESVGGFLSLGTGGEARLSLAKSSDDGSPLAGPGRASFHAIAVEGENPQRQGSGAGGYARSDATGGMPEAHSRWNTSRSGIVTGERSGFVSMRSAM